MSDTISDAQVLLLSALLLSAGTAKLVRVARTRSAAGLGPTMLFPLRLRKPAAVGMCATEFTLGAGVLVTSGRPAVLSVPVAATALRLGTALLFLTAAAALIELRSRRPEAGCGCFGDLSTAPVSLRTIVRCGVLTVAAAASVRAPAISISGAAIARWMREMPADVLAGLAVLAAELMLIAALSPEIGEMLVRLGYRAPCEMRRVPAERTLGMLQSSRAWRRHAHLLTSDEPLDVWREQCWRYAVYRGWAGHRRADVVFAVHLAGWRPRVLAAVTDATTGRVLKPDDVEPVPLPRGEAGPAPSLPISARL